VKIVLLHTRDAVEPPPVDPVIGQLTDALTKLGHTVTAVMVDRDAHGVEGVAASMNAH
jgi:hypothetical protein